MRYNEHYNNLIARAKNRQRTKIYEQHHIVPRCLGGSDNINNLVYLTPEEHYVAHQLLIKIYPDEPKLIYAANMMTVEGTGQTRFNNKRYGWLRRKYNKLCKQRTGKKNGSYGKPWYHDPTTNKCGKFVPGSEPEGWVRGRTSKIKAPNKCVSCDRDTPSPHTKYCLICKEKLASDTETASKQKYIELWNMFVESNCQSMTEFSETDLCPVTRVALHTMWKKYVPEYNPERGKAFNPRCAEW